MVKFVAETGTPMVITQNGEAKAVVMNIREYDQMQQSLALLRISLTSAPVFGADAEYPKKYPHANKVSPDYDAFRWTKRKARTLYCVLAFDIPLGIKFW